MMTALPLAIVGPGRLGRSAAKLLTRRGVQFALVGRGQPVPQARTTWLTVADRDIESAAAAVPAGGVLLHASGARSHEILRPHAVAGSLHPLMTFPGPELAGPVDPLLQCPCCLRVRTTAIPAAVAGDDPAIEAALELAASLGFDAVRVAGDRALYHAAAVTAGNFTTVLMVEAARMLAAAGVGEAEARALLGPLAISSVQNAIVHGAEALTGPAARGDASTVQQHLDALKSLDPKLHTYYAANMKAAERVASGRGSLHVLSSNRSGPPPSTCSS